MKNIESRRDLDAMLQTECAIVLIYFSWSSHAERSLQAVTECQRRSCFAQYPLFELVPDRHPFSWQWLDTIFGEIPEADRTCGTVVWLKKGVVAARLPDASAVGEKALARITSDCFVSGKTHGPGSVWLMQNEPAAFDAELLKVLCCPETHQTLAFADAAQLDRINQRLASGQLRNRGGLPVTERIEDGLVRADGNYLYPMRRNIPVLLADEAIPLR